MTEIRDLAWVALSGAFTFGMVLSFVSGMKEFLVEHPRLGSAGANGLLAAFNLSFIPTLLVAGPLVDVWGAREVLCLGSLLCSLALTGLASMWTYRGGLCAVLLAGVGCACLNCASCVLMPQALFENNATASVGLGWCFFGMGALLTSTLANQCRALFPRPFKYSACLFATLALVPAVLASSIPQGEFTPPSSQIDPELVWLNPRIWLIGLVFSLYGPLEEVLRSSARKCLSEAGYAVRGAGFMVRTIWLIFLGSRLLAACLQQKQGLSPQLDAWLLMLLATLAAVALGNLGGSVRHEFSTWGWLVVALCLGPIFPLLVGLVFESVDVRDQGMSYGMFFAIGTTGNLLLAPSQPKEGVAERPARTRLPRLAFLAVLIVGLVLVIALTK